MSDDASKPRVLIIDNSALIRQLLTDVLSSDSDIELVGRASNAGIAERLIQKLSPDVVTLDLGLPDAEGLSFLQSIIKQYQVSVVVVSSVLKQDASEAFHALELGAIEWIEKPEVSVREGMEEVSIRVCDAVKAAAQAKKVVPESSSLTPSEKLSADAIIPQSVELLGRARSSSDPVIAIGASTGGTEALMSVLSRLPPSMPGIVVVQHMPGHFTKSFAERLNGRCQLQVKEAEEGDIVEAGWVYIAPGDHHVLLHNQGKHYRLSLNHGPLVCRHRPSVDALFRSVALAVGESATGVILTGMGDDGSQGMLEMKQAGAFNIAQDEASSVVYGMPKIAYQKGGVDEIHSLQAIPDILVKRLQRA